jgi:DNA modification methylase
MTEIVHIKDLQPDPQNANKGTERGHYLLEKSLRELGAGRSIVLDRKGRIIAGNKTYETAGAIGLEDVVIVRTNGDKLVAVLREDLDLDEETAKRLAIADNRTGEVSLDWDIDVLTDFAANGLNLGEWWQDFELAEMGIDGYSTNGAGEAQDAEPQINRAEELRQEWQTESGQLWMLPSRTAGQEHRLVCGDCTDAAVVERVMGGEKAGMVFTDPPFATFASSTGKLEITDFGMIKPFYEKLLRATLPFVAQGRALFICCDWRSYPMLFGIGGIDPKNLIVWVHGAMRMGSHFRPQHEFILYALNTSFDRRYSKKNKKYETWKIEDRGIGDVWNISQGEASPGTNRIHISQKPAALPEHAIKHCSLDGEIVGDWFTGSGTVIIAAENLSRQCRAIEISPAYVAVCLQRYLDTFNIRGELA